MADRRTTGGSPAPQAIVVMGVSGCGKTLVGEALAARLGAAFVEGDRLHPPRNVARMSSGNPLTDELRADWLDAIGAEMSAAVNRGLPVVAACSALKRKYRDRLRRFAEGVVFVYLDIDRETARRRVAARKGHFMPASLVDSQFADLEPPTTDECALRLDGALPLDEVVGAAASMIAVGPR